VDIYSGNIFQFVVGSELVSIRPTSEVRQGDDLSSIIFNLATEPFLRSTKGPANAGFRPYLKATAYADDISVVGSSLGDLQPTLDGMLLVADAPGRRFNAANCSSLFMPNGKANPAANLLIREVKMRSLLRVSMRTILGSPWVSPSARLLPCLRNSPY
jgi:Reverse transcriptase (RNA-dependent DNA polymerase)